MAELLENRHSHKPCSLAAILKRPQTIMRIIPLLIFLYILVGCSDRQESTTNSEDFPIEHIKKNSIKRRLIYKLNDFDFSKLQPIDSVFFDKWFNNRTFSNIPEQKIELDRYTRYYFFDYKDFDKMFLFSIVQNDEIGYNNLYHFTYDKAKKEFSQIDFISSSGGDAGEQTTDIIYFNKEGNIINLSSVSTSTEDLDKDTLTQYYDSMGVKIEFKLRKTIITRLDSIKRVDKIISEQ